MPIASMLTTRSSASAACGAGSRPSGLPRAVTICQAARSSRHGDAPRPDAQPARRRVKWIAAELAALATTLSYSAPALAAVDLAAPANAAKAVDNGWLNPIVNSLNFVLGNVEDVYEKLGVPDAYGWSIVSLTLIVKLLTLPLTKKQVESAMATQSLKPRIDIIKERYGEDKKKVQKETSRLYEQAEVNPLAGCLPSIFADPHLPGPLQIAQQRGDVGHARQRRLLRHPVAGRCV